MDVSSPLNPMEASNPTSPSSSSTNHTSMTESGTTVINNKNSSNSNTNHHHQHLTTLPRSVRWRIQLGLLDYDSSSLSSSSSSSSLSATLEDIYQRNIQRVTQQNQRFQELLEKYVEEEPQETDGDIASPTTKEDMEQPSSPPSKTKQQQQQQQQQQQPKVDIDPLTAMVMENEARETRKQELYLKYRKERARRKRGLSQAGGYQGGDESDGIDRASVR